MPISTIDRDVEAQLKDRGVRYTKGRRAVVAALASADGPRSAFEIHQDTGSDVPLSSIYRSLTVLERAEVVVPHFGSKGLTRYELAEWIAGHHHHLICVACGSVEDIDVPQSDEAGVRRAVAAIAARAGFTPIDHTLDIEGRCARCS